MEECKSYINSLRHVHARLINCLHVMLCKVGADLQMEKRRMIYAIVRDMESLHVLHANPRPHTHTHTHLSHITSV